MITVSKARVDRLDLAEQILQNWEAMAALGAPPSENLRLIKHEIAAVASNRDDDPERADKLMRQLTLIADALRRQIV
jgi:hypothetical protein